MNRVVVKVGGSLFDMPDLPSRLQAWLAKAKEHVLLVPGGGATADIVRAWDQHHGLGEEKAHWLALQALSLNAALLANLLPGGRVIKSFHELDAALAAKTIPVADMFALCRDSEQRDERLPHCWNVTSDSLAIWLALRVNAAQLVLLKSVTIPTEMGWDEAARRGFVDSFFPRLVRDFSTLQIEAVNFRLEA